MIYSYEGLLEKYSNYATPKMKIKREVEQGRLFIIKPGLYVDDKNVSKYSLAHIIYGPSYISFETALSYYGIIPERAEKVMCATTQKNKIKLYKNLFGEYLYRDVPNMAFPYGIETESVNSENIIRIASPEKALLDTLYTIKNVDSLRRLKILLFEDMRIDEDSLIKMNKQFIEEVGPLYKKRNIDLLIKLLGVICKTH